MTSCELMRQRRGRWRATRWASKQNNSPTHALYCTFFHLNCRPSILPKTGTTTRGCAGGFLKVRLEVEREKREKVGCVVPLRKNGRRRVSSSFRRLAPPPPPPPLLARLFPPFPAESEKSLCVTCFRASEKRERAREAGSDRGGKQWTALRIRESEGFSIFFFLSRPRSSLGEQNLQAKATLHSLEKARTRLPQGLGGIRH